MKQIFSLNNKLLTSLSGTFPSDRISSIKAFALLKRKKKENSIKSLSFSQNDGNLTSIHGNCKKEEK